MALKSATLGEDSKKIAYIDTLVPSVRQRYLEKVKDLSNDPYKIVSSEWSVDVSLLPDVTYPDIVNYLVYDLSTYTMQQLKAYKSLEAYNYFVSGWVKEVKQRIDNGVCLVLGKVLHSQRLSATPLQPWFTASQDGVIKTAHCTCMAGLGEVCSHVGALLFATEVTVRIRNSKTVTQEKAYWLLPSGLQKIQYKPLKEVNFTSAKTKKKILDDLVNSCVSDNNETSSCLKSTKSKKKDNSDINPISDSELKELFESVKQSGTRTSVMSVMPNFSIDYVPKSLCKKYPTVLSDLTSENCMEMPLNELLEHCKQVTINVSKDESTHVESTTRDQAASKEWHRFRAGRITASRLKSVCCTSIENPSHSLLKNICYPHLRKFSTKATQWGCDHEKVALQQYEEKMFATHENFRIYKSGLVINPDYPHMGATPDAFVSCNCCGDGCVEIKCPYCSRDSKLKESVGLKSCLEEVNGCLLLKRKHEYFYQVQCQIHLCEKHFCDFVVWTEKDFHCERIVPDEQFWNVVSTKAKKFFDCVVLPELVGKFFSRQHMSCGQTADLAQKSTESSRNVLCDKTNVADCERKLDADDEEIICTCQKKYLPSDKVVGCDNSDCKYKWFHFSCVNIKRAPRSAKWYCPTCKKLPHLKKKPGK